MPIKKSAQMNKLYLKKVVSIPEEENVMKAAKLMKLKNLGSLVVTNNKEQGSSPIGIITDRDIVVKAIANSKDLTQTKVKDIMSNHLITFKKNTAINEMLETLAKKGVRRAPIVDENNNMCGIISTDDILTFIAEELNRIVDITFKQHTTVL